ncbi:MAG: ComF family protein, partial [Candidatus Kapaibacterium sp.]
MLRLFLPQICVHCNTHCDDSTAGQSILDNYLCAVCRRQFDLLEPPRQEDLNCNSSLLRELPFRVEVSSGFIFQNQGIIQSLIHHCKYQEMPRLASVLGSICAEKHSGISVIFYYLVPVPLHRTRYAERGYNQSERLAKGISSRSQVSVAKRKWLRRIRQTPSQTGLTVEQREENVRGAFALSKAGLKEFRGKRLLVIDDVMTTGATLASATSALIIANPKRVDLFAMAAVVEAPTDPLP